MIRGTMSNNGFTLIEILVVLSLLGLMISLLPSGLSSLYAKTRHQAVVHEILSAARNCSLFAQQQQRSMVLGSPGCALSRERIDAVNSDVLPTFHRDGTASHGAQIVLLNQDRPESTATVILIDKLTSNVRVQINAQTQ